MRVLVALLIMVAATQAACSRSVQQKDFASAEEAVQALVAAAQSDDTRALLEVLGQEAEPVVGSGDPVQDKNSRQQFLQAYAAAHALDTSVEGRTTLEVGTDKWPFTFPIVQRDGRWRFDSTAGVEEIVNRRVGANEISTIQSCLAFVDAQREYYVRNAQQDSLLHFAQTLVSTEGQKDGLYWPTAGDEEPSPLGEEFAQARSEGYFQDDASKDGASKATPYHGYVYRLLKAQGPNAAGGAYDYMVGDKMLGGFALIASPAEYGSTGVMTFIVNHDGVVFSKDLGPDTAKAARSIEVFDPDQSWTKEAAIE
jgi:Protein of unknown function (DUF2950)